MRRTLVPFLMAGLLAPLSALGQDSFKGLEYISGKDGFEEKIKGVLHVDETEVRFTDKKGRPVFSIPLGIITEVSNSREKEEGSFGRKMALGIFASKDQEYLYVNTETAETAEAVVFKCKKNSSPGIVAKIEFQLKKFGTTEK